MVTKKINVSTLPEYRWIYWCFIWNFNQYILQGNITTPGPVFVKKITMHRNQDPSNEPCEEAKMSFSRYSNGNIYPDDTVSLWQKIDKYCAMFLTGIYFLKTK